MKKPLESSVERRVVSWAKQRGILNTKLNIMSRRGWPDQAFWIAGGRPALIEFKRKGERPTKLQEYILDQLKARGYDVCWTDDYEEATQWLAQLCITGNAQLPTKTAWVSKARG